MNEALMSVMRLFGFGGTGSDQCSRQKSERKDQLQCELRRNGAKKQVHLDEVFVRINGNIHYLWCAVDHEGEVLETFVTKKRDRRAALKFIKKIMKRFRRPDVIVTDKLRSYHAAMKMIGNEAFQETQRGFNNRAENSLQRFRREI